MKNNLPEFVLTYACKKCGFDSSFIEQENKIICPYCHSSSRMVLLQKESLTSQLITNRIKTLTDRTYNNLQLAYDSMTAEEKIIVCDNGNNMENEILSLIKKNKRS